MTFLKEVVAVVGLGYVGLPLAVEFGKKYKTFGYDLSEQKVHSLRQGIDLTGEISTDDIKKAVNLKFSLDPKCLSSADYVIIAVPTPVDAAHIPDFKPLIAASTLVGKYMKPGTIIIFESTVYPGATEEVCIPVIEYESGLKWKVDFHVGYSPERVNPGDKNRTISNIIKVVSGDSELTLKSVSDLYESIIIAGVYRASSIKVAEAAKVIENTQRDLNIALMNELAIIFKKLNIDSLEVLEAASTKWNFMPFRPGLVGGHCIGVDPYYLTHKAEMLGYHPQVILAGRRINDGMPAYIAEQTVKQLISAGNGVKGAKVIIMGLTFKENCSDIRNSKVADLVCELRGYGCEVLVHDPIANPVESKCQYGIELKAWEELPQANAIIAAVCHSQYLDLPLSNVLSKLLPAGLFVDIKSAYPNQSIIDLGFSVWRL